MNILDAAHMIGHDYPGGCSALGPRLGMTGAMLCNKLNPNDRIHKITLDESMRMQALTGDHRILQAMANDLGYALLPLSSGQESDPGIAAMKSIAEFGRLISSYEQALQDGVVSRNELKQVERDLVECISKITSLHRIILDKSGIQS